MGAVGHPSSHAGAAGQRGFTLIEILVVLVIIGIMVGLATVRYLPDDQSTLMDAARALALRLEQAHDQAVASGEPIAFAMEPEAYRFWVPGAENEWLPRADDDVLKPQMLAAGVRVRALTVNGQALDVDERLVFSPAGSVAPFVLDLALGTVQVRLRGDRFGRVRVEDAGEDT